MRLIEAFVHNPVKVSVGVLLFMLFGFIGLFLMPMQLTPEVQIPTITVTTRWPGAAPQEIEREIIQEQEEQLKGVEGVTKMSSASMNSRGSISLEFGAGTDIDSARLKVSTRLQQVPEYPEDADEPVITSSDANDNAIAWFILRPRIASDEQIAAFQQAHPDLAAKLEPVRRAHNSGLRTQRLLRLVEEHPELAPQLEELLPARFFPTPEEVEAFCRRHPQLASRLDSVRNAPDARQQGRQLEKLLLKDPQLRPQIEELLVEPPQLRLFVEDHIEAAFERVKGVSNSNIFGGQEEEMQVIIDPQSLATRQLTISDVARALRQVNRNTTAGDIWDGKRRYVVRVLGQFTTPDEVADVVITRRDGMPVYVRDIAEVKRGFKKPTGLVKNFGTSCIAVNCVRETGANVLDTMAGLREAREKLDRDLLAPRALELIQVYDETDYIYSAIGLVNQNIVIGGLLTAAVLMLFLRSGRSTFIIWLAIPISLIGTFLMLYVMGRSLNVISLAGLAFAVGMLVDNAVVVLENIFRRYQDGEEPFTAAVNGAKEVWGAVVASTLTTLAVFLPVLFVQEEAGQLFRDIALAVSSAVALSLLVSITVIPTAAARILKPNQGVKKTNHAMRAAHSLGGRFVELVVGINARIQRSTLLRLVTVIGFVGTAVLVSWILMPKVEYLPTGNRNLVSGQLLPPSGYNIGRLLELGERLEDATRPYWDIDKDDPANEDLEFPPIEDYFFVASSRFVFFGLRAVDPLRAGELVSLVDRLGNELPGTFAFAQQASLFGRGLQSGRTIDIEITGPDPDQLRLIGGMIMGMVPQVVPDSRSTPVPSLDKSSPEMHVLPKWEQAADMQLTKSELDYAVDALVDGAYAGDYFKGSTKIDLTIVGNQKFIERTQDLAGLPIAVPSGNLVSLAATADIVYAGGPEQINHRERQRVITIQVRPPQTTPLESAIESISTQVVEPLREQGVIGGEYRIQLAGTADKLRATWQALRWNFLLALLITYLLMAALFESWLYPFVIILSVPLGAVGGLIGLALLNVYLSLQTSLGMAAAAVQSLDVLTMLGFVILIGTVVNNAILIVHQSLNHMRFDDMTPNTAILESVRTRIRPIFMTTATTVLGLAPLVLFPGAGSELYRGLGAVVLGGLAISTLFTLILVPTLFSLMMDAKAALVRLLYRQVEAD